MQRSPWSLIRHIKGNQCHSDLEEQVALGLEYIRMTTLPSEPTPGRWSSTEGHAFKATSSPFLRHESDQQQTHGGERENQPGKGPSQGFLHRGEGALSKREQNICNLDTAGSKSTEILFVTNSRASSSHCGVTQPGVTQNTSR